DFPMRGAVLLVWLCAMSFELAAQALEITGIQDTYKGTVGEVIHAPLRFVNRSDRPSTSICGNRGDRSGHRRRIISAGGAIAWMALSRIWYSSLNRANPSPTWK